MLFNIRSLAVLGCYVACVLAEGNHTACCRFAQSYRGIDWRSKDVQKRYIADAIAAERNFFAKAGVGYDAETGMTYDGHGLDPVTGELLLGPWPGGPHTFSAASKESVQISLLALSLQPQGIDAPLLFTEDEALDILERKVTTMEAFDAKYPAYGGFLPWFCSRGSIGLGAEYRCRTIEQEAQLIAPTRDWLESVPALDNGQMAWATYALIGVLSDRIAQGNEINNADRIASLHRRWNKRFERMRASAVPLFYDGPGSGRIRLESRFKNISVDAVGNPQNFVNGAPFSGKKGFWLDDPYEGELMAVFFEFLANWSGYPNEGRAEKKLIWTRKLVKLEPVNFYTSKGNAITVQRGFWYSSHEQWKNMVLPYLDIPLVKQVMTNVEYVRVLHALAGNRTGLFASCNAPTQVECGTLGGYCSAVGIQELSAKNVTWHDVISPYAAFPLMLVDRAAGLAWYNTMLSLPRMQSKYGSVESTNLKGTSIAPLLTWDAKATTVLAMMGGTGHLIKRYMQRDGLMTQFTSIIGSMYSRAFTGRVKEPTVNSLSGLFAAQVLASDDMQPMSDHPSGLPLPPPHYQAFLDVISQKQAADFESCSCASRDATNANDDTLNPRRLLRRDEDHAEPFISAQIHV